MTHEDQIEPLPGGWWARLVEWSFQPRTLGTLTLGVLLVFILPAIPGVWPSVSQSHNFRLSTDRIVLTEPNEWVPHGIAKQLALAHPEWKERNLLEDRLAEDLATEFRKHPWISSVDRVEKTRQGVVKVDVTYRIPIAAVETFQGLVSIDSEGFVLPSSDIRPSDQERLPRLRGISPTSVWMPGQKWNDPLVISGAKLCAALVPQGNLDQYWKKYGLLAVVAPEKSQESPEETGQPPVFELLTLRQRRIVWGYPPDVESHEPSTARKLENLAAHFKKYKSLEQPPGNLYLDNRLLTGIRPRPLERELPVRNPPERSTSDRRLPLQQSRRESVR